MRLALLLGAVALGGACSDEASDEPASTTNSPGAERPATPVPPDPAGIRPIPPIPAALHGCWESIPPTDPEEPGGEIRLIVDSTTITETSAGGEPIVATAELVERVGPTLIEGRFTAYDEHGRRTVATSLLLGPDNGLGVPPGHLRVAEGDAGSYLLSRCPG